MGKKDKKKFEIVIFSALAFVLFLIIFSSMVDSSNSGKKISLNISVIEKIEENETNETYEITNLSKISGKVIEELFLEESEKAKSWLKRWFWMLISIVVLFMAVSKIYNIVRKRWEARKVLGEEIEKLGGKI